MKNFTIENKTNNITINGSAKEAEAFPDSERFGTEAALAKLAANWPAARLIDIWNSLPGATPVRKFKDRATAVSRIWKAIQSLGQAEAVAAGETAPGAVIPESSAPDTATPVAPHAPDVASELASAKTQTTRATKAPQSATDPGTPREGSKTSQVIAMLKGDSGTTLEEIRSAMGWLKHTTRAMLSAGGSLTKKHGLVIVSEKVDGKRVYSIKA
jgi:hypothetical protein